MHDGPTVFVVDDDPSALESVAWLLTSGGFQAETYGSAAEFLEAFDPSRPGCLLLDYHMPGMNGLELQAELARRGSPLPIIFVTGRGDVPLCEEAMKRGAVDCLQKPVDGVQLAEAIRTALERDAQARRANRDRERLLEQIAALTDQQREVLRFLLEGKPTKEIAASLGIGVQTAAEQRANVLEALGVRGEAELVRLLAEHGIPLR